MFTSVSGASVTVVPRTSLTDPGVQFKNQFGYVNVTLAETYNRFTVYANGTMFFDVSGTTAPKQGTYGFQVKSYGNGTLLLRFKGPQPLTVTQTAATSAYSEPSLWQQITYTASQTSQLVLIYAGPAVARNSFTLAALILFGFLSLFFPITFMKWLVDAQRTGQPLITMMNDKRRFVILLIAVTIVGIIGIITIFLEPLLG